MLSDRIRAEREAAPWIIDEIVMLETELRKLQEDLATAYRDLSCAYIDIQALRPKAVFVRDISMEKVK